jgi:hypothetical protein
MTRNVCQVDMQAHSFGPTLTTAYTVYTYIRIYILHILYCTPEFYETSDMSPQFFLECPLK